MELKIENKSLYVIYIDSFKYHPMPNKKIVHGIWFYLTWGNEENIIMNNLFVDNIDLDKANKANN